MLPTFVIGLREGLEAALIVGIIAAFLRKQGRRDLVREVLAGALGAALICLVVGIVLEIYTRSLPQRQQEGLETIIGALAVCMVTYMVIWMKRNSRGLKAQLEGMAADALGAGRSRAGLAMVVMAFLAVIREGLETVVFLLAAFNQQRSNALAPVGAVLGIAVAIALGYGIYRGGVRLDLSKFFRVTGLVLVLVAAGLVVNALRTAHEAGWLDAGQGATVDLSWLVRPGSVRESLLTGMLGWQARPVTIELVAWFAYLIPVGLYVAWPPARRVATRTVALGCAGLAMLGVAGVALGLAAAPAAPAGRPVTSGPGLSAQVVATGPGTRLTARLTTAGSSVTRILTATGSRRVDGLTAQVYRATSTAAGAPGRPATLSAAQVARLNGGRLPIGLRASNDLTLTYSTSTVVEIAVAGPAHRVVSAVRRTQVSGQVVAGGARFALDRAVAGSSTSLGAAATTRATQAGRAEMARVDRRARLHALAGWSAALIGVAALCGLLLLRLRGTRRDAADATPTAEPLPLAASVR